MRPCCVVIFAVVKPVVPLSTSSASTRTTDLPFFASSYAAVTPVIPPPTTQTSTCKWLSNVGNFGSFVDALQYEKESLGMFEFSFVIVYRSFFIYSLFYLNLFFYIVLFIDFLLFIL